MEAEKSLSDLLKEKGLDLSEDAAKLVFDAIMDFAEEVIKQTPNKLDDMVGLPSIPLIKSYVHGLIDKIDKKVG